LLEIPAIDSAAHIVSDLPDSALQFGALQGASHVVVPVLYGFTVLADESPENYRLMRLLRSETCR
jgi:hypothetical protein